MLGVVVTHELNAPQILFAIFVDEKSPLLFIERRQPVDRRQLTKEQRKLLDKEEKARSLLFGDWIEFDSADVHNGFIRRYIKHYALTRSRSKGNQLQFETNCVFKMGDRDESPKCYTEMFGYAKIEPDIANCFMTDVVYDCWISVEISRITTLDISFAEVIEVGVEQTFASQAPWNIGSSRFVVSLMDENDDSDDEGIMEDARYPCEVSDLPGLLTGERSVYCARLLDIPVLLGVIRRENKFAHVGSHIRFDAFRCEPLRAYVVRRFRRVSPELTLNCKMHHFGLLPLLEVSIQWAPELPLGHYWCENKELGLVHDPEGLLLPVMIKSMSYAKFRVYVTDVGPNSFSRFAIKDLTDNAVVCVNKAMEQGYNDLENMTGLFIGSDRILLPQFECVSVQFTEKCADGWQDLSPGTWIVFSAQSACDIPVYTVFKWKLSANPNMKPVEAVSTRHGYAFETRGTLLDRISALKTDVFGLIELTFEQWNIITGKRKDLKAASVWVREGDNNSRARFVLHSIDKPTPEELIIRKTTESQEPNNLLLPKKYCDCTHAGCEGEFLLRRCFNNQSIVSSFVEAKAEDLITRIVSFLLPEV